MQLILTLIKPLNTERERALAIAFHKVRELAAPAA